MTCRGNTHIFLVIVYIYGTIVIFEIVPTVPRQVYRSQPLKTFFAMNKGEIEFRLIFICTDNNIDSWKYIRVFAYRFWKICSRLEEQTRFQLRAAKNGRINSKLNDERWSNLTRCERIKCTVLFHYQLSKSISLNFTVRTKQWAREKYVTRACTAAQRGK
jgi:hypothetical protein